jgi:ligand-binding SRPBCC domain-containing protein
MPRTSHPERAARTPIETASGEIRIASWDAARRDGVSGKMAPVKFVAESVIRASAERVFAFHELPDALTRLTPQWINASVVSNPASLQPGTRAVIDIGVAPLLRLRTEAVHTIYEPPFLFEDQQLKGPFRSWKHRHIFRPENGGTRLTDAIEFEPPFGILGRWLAPWLILPRLRRLFAYRHEVTRAWCEENVA